MNKLFMAQRKFALLSKKSAKAVSVVDKTITDLQSVNDEIAVQQKALDQTRLDLTSTKSTNQKIITNFRKLRAVD